MADKYPLDTQAYESISNIGKISMGYSKQELGVEELNRGVGIAHG
jgi:hypothetical protein